MLSRKEKNKQKQVPPAVKSKNQKNGQKGFCDFEDLLSHRNQKVHQIFLIRHT